MVVKVQFYNIDPEEAILHIRTVWFHSVVVITFGSDPNNPGSNPGGTSFFVFCLPNYFSHYSLFSPEERCSDRNRHFKFPQSSRHGIATVYS